MNNKNLPHANCSADGRLEITLEGSTREELWANLVSLVCLACETKQESGGVWPKGVSQSFTGTIHFKPNAQLSDAAPKL